MKLASLVDIAMLIIYHQGTKKIDWKVLVFCTMCRKNFYLVICMLNYPKNETLPLGDPVPQKARILEVWVWMMFGKNILAPWCASGTLLCWVSPFLHRWICT